MAATTRVLSYHGATGDTTTAIADGGELRHKRADDDTLDLNNPIPIPSSGANYGWRKNTKLEFTTAPSQQASNLRWYADPAPSDWTACALYVGMTATYVQASTNDEAGVVSGVQTTEGGAVGSAANADTFTSDAPMTIVSGVFMQGGTTGVGTVQPYVVTQIEVGSAASPGLKTARNTYYVYDEI